MIFLKVFLCLLSANSRLQLWSWLCFFQLV